MRVLNVVIYAKGGKRLFVHDYDRRIYEFFNVDNIVIFIESFTQVVNPKIAKEDMGMVLFEKLAFILDNFRENSKKTGEVKFTTLVVSELDRSLPFDPQEIVLRHLAEYVSRTFFDCYQKELADFFQTWKNAVLKFQKFRDQLDRIVKTGSIIPDDVIDSIIEALSRNKKPALSPS